MEKIYSKVDPAKLLHIINRRDDIKGRENIIPGQEFLQVASLKLNKNQTFKAHKHIPFEKNTQMTQESWVVIQGSVKAMLYDLDDSILAEPVLKPGDCSITLYGGHNYESLEEDTLVYEYKTGPYFGIENDKVFL